MKTPQLCKCSSHSCSGISININSHSRDVCLICAEPLKLGTPYLYIHRYRGTQGAQNFRCHEECLQKLELQTQEQRQSCFLCDGEASSKPYVKIRMTGSGNNMTLHTSCLKVALSLSQEERRNHCIRSKNPTTQTMALYTYGATNSKEEARVQKLRRKLHATILLENDSTRLPTLKKGTFAVSEANDFRIELRHKCEGLTTKVSVFEEGVAVRHPDSKVNEDLKKILSNEKILDIYCKQFYKSDLKDCISLLLTESNSIIRTRCSKFIEKEEKCL